MKMTLPCMVIALAACTSICWAMEHKTPLPVGTDELQGTLITLRAVQHHEIPELLALLEPELKQHSTQSRETWAKKFETLLQDHTEGRAFFYTIRNIKTSALYGYISFPVLEGIAQAVDILAPTKVCPISTAAQQEALNLCTEQFFTLYPEAPDYKTCSNWQNYEALDQSTRFYFVLGRFIYTRKTFLKILYTTDTYVHRPYEATYFSTPIVVEK